MLLDRQAELSPQLARHGVTLDLVALRDTGRHLLDTRKPARTPLAARLHATLDELQRQLEPSGAAAAGH